MNKKFHHLHKAVPSTLKEISCFTYSIETQSIKQNEETDKSVLNERETQNLRKKDLNDMDKDPKS